MHDKLLMQHSSLTGDFKEIEMTRLVSNYFE